MKMHSKSGFSLVEMMIGIAIFIIVAVALGAAISTFSKTGVMGQRNAKAQSLMKYQHDLLVQQSQGSSWFAMGQSSTGNKHPDFPGLMYDIAVSDIQSGVRQCLITIHWLDPTTGVPTGKTWNSKFTVSYRVGRNKGGSIKVVAVDNLGNPAPDLACTTLPMEGSIILSGKTDGSGIYNFTSTLIGTTTVTCDGEVYNSKFYFPPNSSPDVTPQVASTFRKFNVTTVENQVAVLNMTLARKGELVVQTYRRQSGQNTTEPVPGASFIVEKRNTVVPLPQNYGKFSDVTGTDGTWSRNVVPGDYRVTVVQGWANKGTTTEMHYAGLDQVGTNINFVGYGNVATGQTVTRTFHMIRSGNASGLVQLVSFTGGLFNTGTSVDGVKVWFRQIPVSIWYLGVANGFNLWDSVVARKGWDSGKFPSRSATSANGGMYIAKGVAPMIVHSTAALNGSAYAPENSFIPARYWADPVQPSAYAPIVVRFLGNPPQNRDNVRFCLNATGYLEIYPIGAQNNLETNLFANGSASPDLEDEPITNTGKNVYILDAKSLVRIKGNFVDTLNNPFDSSVIASLTNPTCRLGVRLQVVSGIPSPAYIPGSQVTLDGGNHILKWNPSNKIACTNSSYDLSGIVPPLGTDSVFITYIAQGVGFTNANYNLTAKVNYNYYDTFAEKVKNDDRVNNAADDFSVTMDLQYLIVDTWYQIMSKTVSVVDGTIPVLNDANNAMSATTYSGQTAYLQPDPASITTTNLVINNPAPQMATHRFCLQSGSPVGYTPIGTAYSGSPGCFQLTKSPPNLNGEMLLRVTTPIRVMGRIYNTKGEDQSGLGLKIKIDIDTKSPVLQTSANFGSTGGMACQGTVKCSDNLAYDTNIIVPHTPGLFNFSIHVDDPTGNYESTDSQPFFVTIDNTFTPSTVMRDFELQFKPGKGL